MNKIIFGISLIVIGVLSFLKLIGSTSMSYNEILGISFAVFGFLSVLVNLGKFKRGQLFIGTILFGLGVIFIVINNYEIFVTNSLFFPSFLIITGTGLHVLFIDNTKEKVFFYSSILLIFTGVIFSYGIDFLGISTLANSFGNIFMGLWHIFLLILNILMYVFLL